MAKWRAIIEKEGDKVLGKETEVKLRYNVDILRVTELSREERAEAEKQRQLEQRRLYVAKSF